MSWVHILTGVALIVACLAPIAPFMYALIWGRW